MQKIIFFILLLAGFIASCSDDSVPINIIGPDKMTAILKDMHVAEAAVSVDVPGDSVRQYIADYYTAIYKKHNISQKEFNKSFDYYISHPAKLDKVYQKIIDEINREDVENR